MKWTERVKNFVMDCMDLGQWLVGTLSRPLNGFKTVMGGVILAAREQLFPVIWPLERGGVPENIDYWTGVIAAVLVWVGLIHKMMKIRKSTDESTGE